MTADSRTGDNALRAHTATERWIIAEIQKRIGPGAIMADQTFENIGLKPLEFIELVMTAEETLAIELPDHVVVPCKTPADLATRIVERTARAITGATRA